MIGPTSPATTQIRNNAALDGTRSSSPAARNPAESRADASLPQTAPSDDSVNNGSGSLSEQPSSTSRLSGSENEQPGNPAATLTASQAQAIIADSLDKIATGEIAPFEPNDASIIGVTNAAAAADIIGQLLARDGASASLFERLGIIAAARANEVKLGTNDEELASFDNALETLAIQRFLSATGNPDADPALLSESRDILLTRSFIQNEGVDQSPPSTIDGPADTDLPSPEFEVKLTSTVGQLVRSAIDEPIDTALASDVATLSSDDIVVLLSNVANRMAAEASSSPPLSLDENIDRLESTAAKEYAAIRAQLKADGATEEQLADLDDVVTQVTIQNARLNLDIPLTDSEQSLAFALRVAEETEAQRPAAFSRTELVRNARLDSDSVLTESELRPIQEALAIALQHEATAEFSSGNLLIATFGELSGLLSEAADTIAQALATNDDAKFQRGLELFDQVRDELVRRTPVNTLPGAFINAFEQRIADAQSALQAPGPEADARIENSNTAILSALTDLVVDTPFGIARQNSFEGDNGAESVNIFVIETKPGRASNASAQSAGHDVVITNIIEAQLQEAGQSYDLTNIQTDNETLEAAIESVAEMAEQLEGPTYLNMSIGRDITPTIIETAFRLLRDTDLVPEELLSTPINQENFDLFADTVRSIALAALDPERTDVVEALGEGNSGWGIVGESIQAIEAAAAAGIDVFISTPNDDRIFSFFQFAQDDGLAGSITRVAATTPSNVFDSNDFVLPEQGEDFPENDAAPNGIALGDPTGSFYRGTGVDAYAGGVTERGLDGRLVSGASAAAPEMLVNAVLGRFDPSTETRIDSEIPA